MPLAVSLTLRVQYTVPVILSRLGSIITFRRPGIRASTEEGAAMNAKTATKRLIKRARLMLKEAIEIGTKVQVKRECYIVLMGIGVLWKSLFILLLLASADIKQSGKLAFQ